MTGRRRLDPASRPFLLKIAETLASEWDTGGRVFLVEAPTGYGKTSLSMAIAHYVLDNGFKSIVTYPLRTLIEQQSHLFKQVFGGDVVGTRYMHSIESPYLVKPVTLTTIDTLAMNTLGLPPEDYNTVVNSYLRNPWGYDGHYLFARAMVDLSDIVLDEVHLVMDSTKSIGFLMALLEHMTRLGRNILLMTATLPSTLVETLTNHLSQDRVKVLRFDQSKNDPFVQGRLEKNITIHPICDRGEQCIHDTLKEIFSSNGDDRRRALIIFNTVRKAVEFYSKNKNELEDMFCGNTLLIHSKFQPGHRERKTVQLEDLASNDCYAIVSTQVVEAGLDISSDLLITELAPANSLVQRTGRLARRDEKEGDLVVWYDKESIGGGKYTVYDWDLTRITLEQLIEAGEKLMFHLPGNTGGKIGYRALIEKVYQSTPLSTRGYSDMARQLLTTTAASHKAMDLLIKYEGSFVRDSSLTAILPVENCGETKEKQARIDPGQLIPVSIEEIISLSRKGKLCPVTLRTRNMYTGRVEIDSSRDSAQLVNNLYWIHRKKGLSHIIYKLVRMGVAGFVVEAEYTYETGLNIQGDQQ